ncbi:2-dehydropantoate 2-reductase [Streptomyces sp. WMMC500]|uniref:2-dehydropantoate 2-reductase n=1 Tax=Streptomyces sp. WMMC500 TaxID=3015154 RepID=UPI00248BCB68|nr:2-dehydropantoate 2-reductase [Streptomyces sp. WMMC500]WBB60746.1 2-dehydropantoate 2-reductase [Streptomyces sp. WMMC500]
MKIAVFGAGSIGCHLGGMLAEVADVTLVGRPAAMDALRSRGLLLTGGGRAERRVAPAEVRLATRAEAAAGADYVLVTVKSAATEQAARELAGHLAPGATVVSFQNGLRNPGLLREGLPGRTVLAGMVPYNVVQAAPGVFHQGTAGVLMVDGGERSAPLVVAMAQAGLDVEQRDDMADVQHAKLLMNLNNAINALSGLPLKDQLGQRSYRACLALCQREALGAFRAANLAPARLGPVPPGLMPLVLRLPDWLFRRLAAATLRVDDQARSSMWDDLKRGRPTEIDTLQGEVAVLAGRHGMRTPANSRLMELVLQAESRRSGEMRRWSGADLLAELTAATKSG